MCVLFVCVQIDDVQAINDIISLESVDAALDSDLAMIEPTLNQLSHTVRQSLTQLPPTVRHSLN